MAVKVPRVDALKIIPPQQKPPSDCQSKQTLSKEGSLLGPCYMPAGFM